MSSKASVPSNSSSLSDSFSKLHEVEWEKREAAIQLLLKLMQNILKEPDNLKFRRLKRSNATLQAKLFSVQGCSELLQAVGFENAGADELVLQDTADIARAVEELQSFGNRELMQHLREEQRIAKGIEVDSKKGAERTTDNLQHQTSKNATADDCGEEQIPLLLQLELDRKERAERQQMKQQAQTLQKATREREDRRTKDKVHGISDLNAIGTEKDFWQTSKGKKKAWVQSKKKGKKGRGTGNNKDFGTGRGGRASGYKEIPIPSLDGIHRTLDRETAACLAISAAESRINRAELEERRLQELENKQSRESKAIAAHRTARSRKLALECQQAAMRASEAVMEDVTPHVPPLMWSENLCEVLPHQVPADNSCLFHAVAYLIRSLPNDTASLSPSVLREFVANCVMREPDRWKDAVLADNRTVDEYSRWITHPSSWGGFVDLIVLSEHYQIQISVISLESLYWTHYPDDAKQYDRRVYLLYDGVHYDAVVGHAAGVEILVFNSCDEVVMNQVTEMARAVRREEQETTIYQCQECQAVFFGQADVAKHSFDTCHSNFREIAFDETEGADGSEKVEQEEEEEEEDDEDDEDGDGDDGNDNENCKPNGPHGQENAERQS